MPKGPGCTTVVALVAFSLVAPTRASAAPKKKDAPAAVSGARALYTSGIKHYDLGEFDEAIVAFKQSYELSAAPGLLFNLAQAYRKKRDFEQALYFYRTFLRLEPRAGNRKDVEALIAEMEAGARSRSSERASTSEPASSASERAPGERAPGERAPGERAPAAMSESATPPQPPGAREPSPSAAPVAAPSPETPAERSGAKLRYAGIAVAAVGAALLGGAIYAGVRASSDSNQLGAVASQGGTWTQHNQDLYNDGKSSALAATVLYAAGGAAVATGAILYLAGWRRDRGIHVGAQATSRGASLELRCGF